MGGGGGPPAYYQHLLPTPDSLVKLSLLECRILLRLGRLASYAWFEDQVVGRTPGPLTGGTRCFVVTPAMWVDGQVSAATMV